ncbi:hypothetical protein WICPIJ_009779 [Wickerhamomyces pijperi]|uniref:tRNA pseudouridine(55) synthase n=2 Tax=Wickerhamomyces TaxID=599737 RepID=A0A9P8PJW8_WICPI|nr:hypothetical protein WICPIJ_009779 [Wickerhamomyces pijperi]
MSTKPKEMNGIFAINKPSGITSSTFLSKLQRIFTNSSVFAKDLSDLRGAKIQQLQKENGGKGQFKASRRQLRKVEKVKLGHGGTLDPLACGVLVVGVGKGTKRLQNYLNGSVKVYETEALFGIETTSADVEGEILLKSGYDHITMEQLNAVPEKFIGEVKQTPPIFSALKVNGKPLYEYARNNIALPKEIKSRDVTVYEMEIFKDSLTTDHKHEGLTNAEIDKTMIGELKHNPTLNEDFHKVFYSKEYCSKNGLNPEEKQDPGKPYPESESESESSATAPPLLHFRTKVSSGTYIRSLISDVAKCVHSNAYMVKLIREKQAEWDLNHNVFQLEDFEQRDELVWGDVLRRVLHTEDGATIGDLKSWFEEAEEKFKAEIEEKKRLAEEKKQLEQLEEQKKKEEQENGTQTKTEEKEPENVNEKKRTLEE